MVRCGKSGYSNSAVIYPVNNSSKDIVLFSLNGVVIDAATDEKIEITTPLKFDKIPPAVFVTTGDKVSVNGVEQISGITQNDFSKPAVYVVTAVDGTTKSYTVTVTSTHAITPIAHASYVGYYPKDCTLNDPNLGTGGTCQCIRNIKKNVVWLVTPNLGNYEKMENWAKSLNDIGACGLKSNWSLPGFSALYSVSWTPHENLFLSRLDTKDVIKFRTDKAWMKSPSIQKQGASPSDPWYHWYFPLIAGLGYGSWSDLYLNTNDNAIGLGFNSMSNP